MGVFKACSEIRNHNVADRGRSWQERNNSKETTGSMKRKMWDMVIVYKNNTERKRKSGL